MLAVGATMAAGIVAAHLRKVRVPRERSTSTKLRVVLDSSAIEYADGAQRAVKAWRDHKPDSFAASVTLVSQFKSEAAINVVLIRMAHVDELPGNVKARAYRHPADGGVIEWAEVAIGRLEAEHADLALAHELGHCLGYGHPTNAPKGHLLAKDADRIGWSFKGIV